MDIDKILVRLRAIDKNASKAWESGRDYAMVCGTYQGAIDSLIRDIEGSTTNEVETPTK